MSLDRHPHATFGKNVLRHLGIRPGKESNRRSCPMAGWAEAVLPAGKIDSFSRPSRRQDQEGWVTLPRRIRATSYT